MDNETKSVLNLGCGRDYVEGAINVDFFASKVDVRHDLEATPYPFSDNEFDEIRCLNIIEHLDNIFGVMQELHRIGRAGSLIRIRVPHFRSACLYEDITHKRGFAWKSFDIFTTDGDVYGEYTKFKFHMVDRSYTPYKITALYKILSMTPSLTDNLLSKYIPMASIMFTLRVVK